MSADQIVRYRTLPEIALHCHSRSNQRQMWNYKRGQTEYDIEPSITVGNYIPDKRPIAGNLHLPIHAGDYLAPTKARIVVSKSSGSLPRISPRRGDTTAVSPARIAAHAVAHSLDRFNPWYVCLSPICGSATYSSTEISRIRTGFPTARPSTSAVSARLTSLGPESSTTRFRNGKPAGFFAYAYIILAVASPSSSRFAHATPGPVPGCGMVISSTGWCGSNHAV